MPSLLPVSADVSMEVLTISDSKVPKKPRRHTQKSVATEALGVRGKRQRWKRWHGCRRAQEAEAQELLRGIDSSHGSDAQTAAAKRARRQNLLHRLKPAERSCAGKGTNAGLQRRCGHGLGLPFIWAWVGLVQGLVTEVLAPLSDHMEELNKLSTEERCGMVKHCRIDKTFQPQQCRVTLGFETLRLRYAVEKALNAFQGEGKQGRARREKSVNQWVSKKKA